ncbi:IPTL-CTERM sorting domain-containing protein [Candidatus Kapabacteria bacterium]|nr:IPTL-CTERM sorting domain-containing protein [Candidatus Kapabacteria bacterium]
MKRILLIVFFISPFLMNAATITVTNNNDTGAGSLRQAVLDANAQDIIQFNGSMTITLNSEIAINKNITIAGHQDGVTLDGNLSNRHFNISSATITISDLTFFEGRELGAPANGGSIHISAGDVTIERCLFQSNSVIGNNGTAGNNGGGPGGTGSEASGGAIYNADADLTIINCTFYDNTAQAGAGGTGGTGTMGLLAPPPGTPGGIGGVGGDGGNAYGAAVASIDLAAQGILADITNCTFDSNIATGGTGGTGGAGGVGSPIGTIGSNGNSGSSEGGGVYSEDKEDNATGSVTNIINSIFVSNTADTGPDIRSATNSDLEDLLNNAIETTTGYVVDNNNSGNVTWNSTGYTASLSDNGGPTQTIEILETFNGVDAGSNTNAPSNDQRSISRDNSTDIGAFEFESPSNEIGIYNLAGVGLNNASSASITMDLYTRNANATYTFNYGTTSNNYTESSSSTISGSSATVNVGFTATGLTANTQYYVQASATNTFTVSDEVNFWTLIAEPASHSNFSQVGEDVNQIELSFDAFSGLTNVSGYLILRSVSSFGENDLPSDGNPYNVNDNIGNSIVVAKIIVNSTTNHTFTGLSKDQSWQYALVPFNLGANVATVNYKTDNVPTITGFTIPTLGEWGMIAFVGLMLIGGVWYSRRI